MGECSASQCAVNTLISKQLSTQSVAYYCLQFSNTILQREINWKRSTPIDEGPVTFWRWALLLFPMDRREAILMFIFAILLGLAIWCSSIYSVWYTLWLCNATKEEKTKSIIECDVAWLVFNGNFAFPSTDNGVGELVINIWAHCWLNYEFTISFSNHSNLGDLGNWVSVTNLLPGFRSCHAIIYTIINRKEQENRLIHDYFCPLQYL